ncbi:conjugative transposon protein TraJ [Hymenobacter defluvii]|uniref:Conjugative transposon protein TraJ n=1 Tax=Hymenobacter defluvii TaxID=2054411 RepID=A0ABS3TES5_9BACT|nr:conjugative transposon protein TraJ [Hymenobacter defluvii]MBO3272163.1 conjugative transposon protein TraJ [Hymenobacter defluvii]
MLLALLLQVSTTYASLQKLLDSLYTEMLPLVSDMMLFGRALAGLGALIYISSRVYGHMARAESIDFLPLLRPIGIGMAIAFFPGVLAIFNGVLGGLTNFTDAMVNQQNAQIVVLMAQKQTAMNARPENAAFVSDEAFERELEGKSVLDFGKDGAAALYLDKFSYDVKSSFRNWIKNVLELSHYAASLVLNTIRTFFLIILSIIGPLSFGFAVWPGFEGTLNNWIARYVNVFLWLPVANIFGAMIGKIQIMMLQLDISQIQSGGSIEQADMGYLIFLIIAIAGYFTVPSVAGWIVASSGMSGAIKTVQQVGSTGASLAGAATGNVAGRAASMGAAMAAGSAPPPPSLGAATNSAYKNTAV